MVQVGYYLLRLQSPPAILERGWVVRKNLLENIPINLLFCTRSFVKSYNINFWNPYIQFNFFPKSKAFYIMGYSRSLLVQLMVNSNIAIQWPYYLNQYSIKILLDKLEYYFQWMEFAAKDNFKEVCRCYMARALSRLVAANIDVKMPTLLPNKRMMGRQILKDILSVGGYRRVFFALDQSANIAAIKVVEWTF